MKCASFVGGKLKILLLTAFEPLPENIGGPNALLYQLLAHTPKNFKIDVRYFPIVTSADKLSIYDGNKSFSVQNLKSDGHSSHKFNFWWPSGAKALCDFDFPDLEPFDSIWCYPYWFAPLLKSVKKKKNIVITGMDCATLLYYRMCMFTPWSKPKRKMRSLMGLLSNAFFEHVYLKGIPVHVVGQKDKEVLQLLGVPAQYIPHPLLPYPQFTRSTREANAAVRILFSRSDDEVYGSNLYYKWISEIKNNNNEREYEIILHKFKESSVMKLRKAFPEIAFSECGWVKDYSELLSSIDIQCFPLEIGAGTKTSVLTALQHGVHCYCSNVAIENIQQSVILTRVPKDANGLGQMINFHINRINEGKDRMTSTNIIQDHDPMSVSDKFWALLGEKDVL
jgi:hypothetical protein